MIYENIFLQCTSSKEELIYDRRIFRKRPTSWNVVKAKDVFDIMLGGTPSTEKREYWDGTFNWLNSGEVSNFPVVTSELKISQAGIDNSATKLLPEFSTLISITGNIRVSISAIETCANQSVIGIPQSNEFHCSYIYPFICDCLNYFEKISGGNCQKHISKGTIDNLYVLIPPKTVLNEYYSLVDNYYKEIFNNALESKKLSELRDELLPLLMNGQATISD